MPETIGTNYASVGLDSFRLISTAEQYQMNSDIKRYRDNLRDELNGGALRGAGRGRGGSDPQGSLHAIGAGRVEPREAVARKAHSRRYEHREVCARLPHASTRETDAAFRAPVRA